MNGKKFLGYLLAFVAAATYGLNPLFALPLMADGMDTPSILFFRYLLAVPIVGVMMAARGKSPRVKRCLADTQSGNTAWREVTLTAMLLGFGLLVALSSLTLFESYRYMDAGVASTMLFVYPIMVALMMSLFFRERLTATTMLCLIMAFVGVCLMYYSGGSLTGGTVSGIGTLYVMGSALSYAIYIVGVNRSALSRVPTLTVTFYILIAGVLLFGANLWMTGHIFVPQTWQQWFGVAALAIFPTTVSFFCTTLAISYIGSTPTAILGAMEPVTAVVIGITVFGEPLTARNMVGLALILAAVTLVVTGGYVAHPLTAIRRLFPSSRHRR